MRAAGGREWRRLLIESPGLRWSARRPATVVRPKKNDRIAHAGAALLDSNAGTGYRLRSMGASDDSHQVIFNTAYDEQAVRAFESTRSTSA